MPDTVAVTVDEQPPIRVRAAESSDAAAIAALYRPYVEATAVSFEETAPDLTEWAIRMRSGLPWLVAVAGEEVVGCAYASAHRARAAYRWAVDVSIYLAPSAQRKGTGRALYTELLGLLRDCGYVTAHAGITLPNAASVQLHERLGFERVGVYPAVGFKLGRWHDVGWWRQALRELPDQPPEPTTWSLSPVS